MIFGESGTGFAKKPFSFVIFQGGSVPLSTPLDPRMAANLQHAVNAMKTGM